MCMEGNAEFYSSPQLALMALTRRVRRRACPSRRSSACRWQPADRQKDQDGDSLTGQQLQQASMQPHSDMLRSIAAAFSRNNGIARSSLGIIHDQPASAEAIRAVEHDLLIDATDHSMHVHSASVADIATLTAMVRDDLTEPPKDAWR